MVSHWHDREYHETIQGWPEGLKTNDAAKRLVHTKTLTVCEQIRNR